MSTNNDTPPAPECKGVRHCWNHLSACQRRGVCAAVVAVLVLFAVIAVVYMCRDGIATAIGYRAAMDEMTAGAQFFRDFVALFAVIVGMAMAAWRSYSLNEQAKAANEEAKVANKQAKTSSKQFELANKRLRSEQFVRAAEAMSKENKDGKPLIAARISGIYLMKDLAIKQQKEFAEQVVINLIAYIKDNAQLTAQPPLEKGKIPDKPRMLGGDVKTAFSVLHDILGYEEIEVNEQFLDFSYQNFSYLDLGYLHVRLQHYHLWIQTNFKGAKLCAATFGEGAVLVGADFTDADMRLITSGSRVDMGSATMTRANLSGADLSRANLTGADLNEAIISDDTKL